MGKQKQSEQADLDSIFGKGGGQSVGNVAVSSSVMSEIKDEDDNWGEPPHDDPDLKEYSYDDRFDDYQPKQEEMPLPKPERHHFQSYEPPKPKKIKIGKKQYLDVTELIMNENEIYAMSEIDTNNKLFAIMSNRK